MKTLLSGVQPTGRLHIGNYFGAIRQFIDMQNEHETFVFIADLHALTTVQNREQMMENIINQAIDYLALGLDPEKVTLYKQSAVPQVTEAAWIFNCLTTMPYLMRAHSFKDAEAKNKEINVGLFDYPILMAADILLVDADVVPVGKDQKQHLEIARDTAEKFNNKFGETFKLPTPVIIESVETIPGTDGQKMSKSYNNTIPLFSTREEIQKIVMSIATDSKGPEEAKNPDETNLYKIHKLFISPEKDVEIRARYESGISYKDAKEALIEDIDIFMAPLRESRLEWQNKPSEVVKILEKGAEKAGKRIENKMKEVREKVGFFN